MEVGMKSEMELALSAERQKETILNGIFSIYAKGTPMPAELQGLTKEIITNVGLPLFAQNVNMVSNAMQPQEEQTEQQPDNEQQESTQQQIQQPQQEMAA